MAIDYKNSSRSELTYGSTNNGRNVYQAMAGKKCIGTASAGKNSGNGMSSGSGTAIGMIMLPNEKMVNAKLKTISPLLGNSLFNNQYTQAAIRQLSRQIAARLPILIILEKSISVAKK